MRIALPLAAIGLALALSTSSRAADIDWTKVDAALGKTAAVQGDVHRYGIPRSDLKVIARRRCNQTCIGAWWMACLRAMQEGAMVMGDLVLTETEVNPVMSKLMAKRYRHHCPAQSSYSREPPYALPARSRAWRSGRIGDGYPDCTRGEQDTILPWLHLLSSLSRSISTPTSWMQLSA